MPLRSTVTDWLTAICPSNGNGAYIWHSCRWSPSLFAVNKTLWWLVCLLCIFCFDFWVWSCSFNLRRSGLLFLCWIGGLYFSSTAIKKKKSKERIWRASSLPFLLYSLFFTIMVATTSSKKVSGGSALKRLKTSLQSAGVVGQQSKASRSKKDRKKGKPSEVGKVDHSAKLAVIRGEFNPYEMKTTRTKFDVVGRKIKGVSGKPTLSKQVGEDNVSISTTNQRLYLFLTSIIYYSGRKLSWWKCKTRIVWVGSLISVLVKTIPTWHLKKRCWKDSLVNDK